MLRVRRATLYQLRGACSRVREPEWVLKIPLPDQTASGTSGGLSVTWQPARKPSQATWLVAIHPNYASYSRETGLELGQPSQCVPAVCYAQPPLLPRYSYK